MSSGVLGLRSTCFIFSRREFHCILCPQTYTTDTSVFVPSSGRGEHFNNYESIIGTRVPKLLCRELKLAALVLVWSQKTPEECLFLHEFFLVNYQSELFGAVRLLLRTLNNRPFARSEVFYSRKRSLKLTKYSSISTMVSATLDCAAGC